MSGKLELGTCDRRHDKTARYRHTEPHFKKPDCVNWREGESAPAQPAFAQTGNAQRCEHRWECNGRVWQCTLIQGHTANHVGVCNVIDLAEAAPPAAETAHTRNSGVLADFIKYCEAHPDQRFWQALRNWSEYPYVLVSGDKRTTTLDTFHWEGRRHDK